VTLPAARLYLLDEDDKIKVEQVHLLHNIGVRQCSGRQFRRQPKLRERARLKRVIAEMLPPDSVSTSRPIGRSTPSFASARYRPNAGCPFARVWTSRR
jgi:hypothetical protein